ncbi:MAG: hypothetical protein IT179_04305 [Acidobacteria bacterium]|nr:hypothetical protein [Acidobacteriota bacterium]
MRTGLVVLALSLIVPVRAWAQGVTLGGPDDAVQMDITAVLDFEGYDVSSPPPGLVYGDGGTAFNPRLRLHAGTRLGPRVSAFVQLRADRGFDPLQAERDFRADEYYLRLSVAKGGQLTLVAGKSATVVGSWVARHYSWENPFVNAPLPYENVTIMWDRWSPSSPDEFLGYLQQPDRKADMLPMIWGPAYTTGLSAFGTAGRWDYGVEVKNAGLSSRPADWDVSENLWRRPTVSGRAGFRPTSAWNIGLSLSRGHYLTGDPSQTLLSGARLGDFHQTTIGQDISYAHGHLQLWSEVFWSQFDVQRVGQVQTSSYYVEGKYKLTPQLFVAARWGQQFFSDVSGAPWDGPASRAEVAVGYRFSRRLQVKAQYGRTSEDRPVAQGPRLAALQITIRL